MDPSAALSARTLKLKMEALAVGYRRTLRRTLWDALARGGSFDAQCECLLWEPRAGAELSLGDYLEDRRRGYDELPSFVFRLNGPILIEPKYGYAIGRPAQLIDVSLTHGWRTHSRRGREWMGLPSIKSYAASAIRRPAERLPEAVSLLSPWPDNFYHFLVDVLPKLLRFEDVGLSPALPIVLHQALSEMPFFKDAVRRGALKDRKIVPVGPASGYVDVGTLYVANNAALSAAQAKRLLALLGVEPRATAPSRRIFVTRAARRGRNIENIDELMPAFAACGFEVVDTDDMTLSQQIELFRSASHVAAVHGAGMTNILFNVGQPLKIFEVIPFGQDESMQCFRIMSGELGYELERFHGVEQPYPDKRAPFRVDAAAFRDKLQRFVGSV